MAQQNQNQQDLREILQIRRDKLAALQEAGMNPFEITRYDVTHHAQEVKHQYFTWRSCRYRGTAHSYE